MCGEHAGTIVDTDVSPEQVCILEKFPVCLGTPAFTKDTKSFWRGSLSTSPDSRCEASSPESLPAKQPRLAISIRWASTRTTILVFRASYQDTC